MGDAESVPRIDTEGWGPGGACEGLSNLRETGDGTEGVRYAGKKCVEGEIFRWADAVWRDI